MYKQTARFCGLLGLLFALAAPAPSATGCMAVGSDGRPVRVMDEAAVIVWDAGSHTEHFIRRATFNTAARDLGFLVPTPTKPELASADDGVFRQLEERMKPEHREEVRRHLDLMPLLLRPLFPESES